MTKKHDEASSAPVERRVIRPGKGWKHIHGPVYEHKSGARIHALGYVRLPNGDFLSDTKYPECLEAELIIRMNSGNRRRELMAWAWAMTHNVKLSRAARRED